MINTGVSDSKHTHYDGNITDTQPSKVSSTTKTAPVVEKPVEPEYTPGSAQSGTQNTELTLENFKKNLVEETGTEFIRIESRILIERFRMVIANMSDDEKTANLMFVMENFSDRPELIDLYIDSFQDPKKAQEWLDNIDFDTIQVLNSSVLTEIVKHMSAPGANKVFDQCKDGAYTFYYEKNHKEIIDRVYKNNLSDEERQAIIDSLSEDEKAIIDEYNRLTYICLTVTKGVVKNKNISQEDKEQFIVDSWNFMNELPSGDNRFLDDFAKMLSNDSDELNIDKTKLKELLEKISDNKFSEAVQKLSDKTSIDPDTGLLKKKSEEFVFASKERKNFLTQEIALNTTEEADLPQVERIDNPPQETKNDNSLLQALNGTHCFEALKDVFTGKIDTTSEAEEQAAIENYKLLNTAVQGFILQYTTGEFFNELLDVTKTSTLKGLMAIGWKGKSIKDTNEVQKTVEERNDNMASSHTYG